MSVWWWEQQYSNLYLCSPFSNQAIKNYKGRLSPYFHLQATIIMTHSCLTQACLTQAESSLTALPSPPTDPGSGRPSSGPGSSTWACCWSSSGSSRASRPLCSRTRSFPLYRSPWWSFILCEALCDEEKRSTRAHAKEWGAVRLVMSYQDVIFMTCTQANRQTGIHSYIVTRVTWLTGWPKRLLYVLFFNMDFNVINTISYVCTLGLFILYNHEKLHKTRLMLH